MKYVILILVAMINAGDLYTDELHEVTLQEGEEMSKEEVIDHLECFEESKTYADVLEDNWNALK